MFGRIKNYVSRHKQKFVVGGIIFGGAYLLSRFAQKLIKDWQERETKELLERARKQLHYESIERICNQTALTMALNLKETINKYLKTEEFIQQLRTESANKLIIWEKLKILAFTKVSALIYTSCLLIVTLRIQLNLIGGYMFYDTTKDSSTQVTTTIQEKYLTLSQFFVEDGAKKLCEFIEEKVNFVLRNKSLKQELTIQDIEQLFWAIQTCISHDSRNPCRSLSAYILPEPLIKIAYSSDLPAFDKIVVETNDLLESEEVTHLTESCISIGFSYMTDQVAQFFKEQNDTSKVTKEKICSNVMPTTSSTPDVLIPTKASNNFVNLSKVAIPMAKVIPIVNGMLQNPSSRDDVYQIWIQQLILMDSLKVMGANIYETFSSRG